MRTGADLTLPPNGTQRPGPPTACTALSVETRSLAITISRTGAPSSPFSNCRPAATTEKVLDQRARGPDREAPRHRGGARVEPGDARDVEPGPRSLPALLRCSVACLDH